MKHLLLFVLSFGFSFAQSNETAYQWFQQFKSLHSSFTQYVFQNEQPAQVSKGELWFKAPFYFRANYTKPSPLELVSNGTTFYNYDVELMQVTVKPTTELANEGILEVLSGARKLNERYSVTTMAYEDINPITQQYVDKESQFYQLIPKHTDAMAARFLFVLSDEKLHAISVEDDFGTSLFEFHDADVNSDIEQTKFVFHVPDSVDLLGEIDESNPVEFKRDRLN